MSDESKTRQDAYLLEASVHFGLLFCDQGSGLLENVLRMRFTKTSRTEGMVASEAEKIKLCLVVLAARLRSLGQLLSVYSILALKKMVLGCRDLLVCGLAVRAQINGTLRAVRCCVLAAGAGDLRAERGDCEQTPGEFKCG